MERIPVSGSNFRRNYKAEYTCIFPPFTGTDGSSSPPWFQRVIILISVLLQRASSQCTLPANLRGDYISADKGLLSINETHIAGYEHSIPAVGLGPLTFRCVEIRDQKYVFIAEEEHNIFGLNARFHTCFEIHEVTAEIFYYYTGKERDAFAQERIYVELSNAATPAFDDICDRTEPYELQTYITLLKNVSVSSINTTCPTDLHSVFSNITFTDSGGTEICHNSSLSGCVSTSELVFSLDTDCTKRTFSAGDNFHCIHHLSNKNGTYLALYNTDSTVDDTNTFRFTCFAYRQVQDILYATESPRYCFQTASPLVLPTGGHKYVFASIQESCVIPVSTTTTAPAVANLNYLFFIVGLVVLLLLIHCIVLARLLYRDYGCICLKKKLFKLPRKVKDIDVRKGEKVRPIKFKTIATIATAMTVPKFRPKREVDCEYPIYDPNWDPMSLTQIRVPKINVIYHDSIEDYMRGRLPRSVSRSSLHSFDSIPWVSDVTESSSVSSYSSY